MIVRDLCLRIDLIRFMGMRLEWVDKWMKGRMIELGGGFGWLILQDRFYCNLVSGSILRWAGCARVCVWMIRYG